MSPPSKIFLLPEALPRQDIRWRTGDPLRSASTEGAERSRPRWVGKNRRMQRIAPATAVLNHVWVGRYQGGSPQDPRSPAKPAPWYSFHRAARFLSKPQLPRRNMCMLPRPRSRLAGTAVQAASAQILNEPSLTLYKSAPPSRDLF
jgi:hypothetical protein